MPILDDKAKAEFAAAAAGLPSDDTEEVEVDDESEDDASEPDETSTVPPPAESGDVVEQEEVSQEGQHPPAAPAPAPTPKAIPYDRFKQVNDQLRASKERQAEYERQLADVDALAKAKAAEKLRLIAENNPELRNFILGEEAPEPEPMEPTAPAPAAPAAAGAKPKDPYTARIEELDKRLRLQEQARRRMEQEQHLNVLQERIEEAMEKHPILQDDRVSAIAQKLIGREVLAQPDKPPAKIVDEVAAELKAFEEQVKKQYVGGKRTAAKTVPAGVGGGGGAPPGQHQSPKLSLADGTTKKAFAAGLKQLRKELEG